MNKSTAIAMTVASLLLQGCSQSMYSNPTNSGYAPIIKCGGLNACRGQSECATGANACRGKNQCRGSGWLNATQAECEQKGGRVLKTLF